VPAVGRDLATTRARLAVTEMQLAAAKAEASAAQRGGGKAAAVAALEAVLEGQDEEVARLRVLLSQVSRMWVARCAALCCIVPCCAGLHCAALCSTVQWQWCPMAALSSHLAPPRLPCPLTTHRARPGPAPPAPPLSLCCSQQEHLNDVHPYKPFPLEQLEAAVAAVPLESYPRQERLLAQFGREFVYSRAPGMGLGAPARDGPAAAAAATPAGSAWRLERLIPEPAAGSGAEAAPAAAGAALATVQKEGDAVGGSSSSNRNGNGNGSGSGSSGGNGGSELQSGQPADVAALPPLPPPYVAIQPWLKDCLSFAAMYPRVAGEGLCLCESRAGCGGRPPGAHS
jgi:uncharacterized membrane protein YgcG